MNSRLPTPEATDALCRLICAYVDLKIPTPEELVFLLPDDGIDVVERCRKRDLPVLFVLEGGYHESIEPKLLPLHSYTFKRLPMCFRRRLTAVNRPSMIGSPHNEQPQKSSLFTPPLSRLFST